MGFLLGLLNGFVTSLEHRNIRRAHEVDTVVVNILRFLFASISLFILALVFDVFALPSTDGWIYVVSSILIEIVVMFTYVKAFQVSEQSLVGPLFGLSLVFLTPLGVIFLGEHITAWGLFGISLIIIGVFVLGWISESNVVTIIKRLIHEPGTFYMMVAAFFAAGSVTVVKISYLVGFHPLNFGFWVMSGLLISHVIYIFLRGIQLKNLTNSVYITAGLFSVGMVLHYVGLNFIFAAYYIALKRSSMVFDVLIGKILGNEINFRQKMLGVLIIFIGVVFISVS